MLGESQLNVYVLSDRLTPRQRQRIQAQVQTALRSIPSWVFELLRARIDALGVQNLPFIVEPQVEASPHVLSLGMIESRPAVRLLPEMLTNEVEWGQDIRYLVAKAVAYMAAPPPADNQFWRRWSHAARRDELRQEAAAIDHAWRDESERGLLVEVAAAYIQHPDAHRWSTMPRVKSFLDDWRGTAADML